ncbi:MAG: amidohydrolase family protein [Alphaproteobacteria bacterium]|nr:amidohydrolase family protein [Alphaproteobacteria bacterium]
MRRASFLLPVGLLLALTACKDKGGGGSDTGPGDTDGGTDTDTDTDTDGGTDSGGGDTGTTDPGDPPAPGELTWTVGPELPDCTARSGSGDLVALSGVLLLPEGPEAGVVVYDRGSGEITCAGDDCDTAGAELICTEGVISAGLIDAHDHLQYNVIPPWRIDPEFYDRYDWRGDGRYWDYREAYDAIEEPYLCEIMRWAELRVLVGGGTSAVGSSGDECIEGLVRNLDEGTAEHGLSGYRLYYSASTVDDRFDSEDGDRYTEDLASGDYEGVLNHVAEGIEGTGTHEVDWMLQIGMSGPGYGFVHATDATTRQLAQMSMDGTTIIWSPRSNLALYAQTTPADIAAKLGVQVALGPDWTWSGSLNPAHEGACAVEYLDARGNPFRDDQLHAMITDTAARAVGADAWTGALEPGLQADIAVFPYSSEPYRAVLQPEPDSVKLTVVGGEALYGESALLTAARGGDVGDCETIDACGTDRTVCATSASSGAAGMTAAELADALESALGATTMPSGLEYAGELHGLFDCEDSYPSCDPRDPSTGDEDGDGVDDDDDVCVGWFDPVQGDIDGDGWGDACDPCPLAPFVTECRHDPDDVDGDGVRNDVDDCPIDYDPDQGDRDGDDKGDACDACPDEPNPGDQACTLGVDAIRDPSHPSHPDEGTIVTLQGMIVTAVGSSGAWVQDPDLSEFAGIYVYSGGAPGVSAGDEVTVTGTYEEYYDLSELTDPSFEVTGSGSITPKTIADPCSVGTDGTAAEAHESMLLVVSDVTVSSSNPDSGGDYGEFEVGGCLRVDDTVYDFGTQPAVDTTFRSITGVLYYSFENFKLEPRSAGDLVE